MTDKIKPSAEFVTLLDPNSIASEAYKTLRTNISLRSFDSEIKTINVISSTAAESKSTTAINLGYVYSQLKKNVLVIDMDLRKPTLHKKLEIKNKLGIIDIATNRCKFEDAVIHYAPHYDVLPAGSKTPFASEFIQSSSFKRFIEACKKQYDMVIIDCPPINLVSDGIILSTYTDGTILCVGSGKVEKKELQRAKDQLSQFDVNILGIVMTRMPLEKKGYGYGYGYGYYSDDSKKKK